MDTKTTLLLPALFLFSATLFAQLNTGVVEGTIRAPNGHPVAGAAIVISGTAGFRVTVHADTKGEFTIVLPYGRYVMAGKTVLVDPLQTARVSLVLNAEGVDQRRDWHPMDLSLSGLLLSQDPSTVTQPLDFTGLSDNRLAVASQRAFSWTDTQYKLNGMDLTDSYQPGLSVIVPDLTAVDQIVVRSAFAQTTSSSFGTEAGVYARGAGESSWHGSLYTADTGAALASSNLPAPADRGIVQQADQFQWFTRDGLQVGGPIAKWADLFASTSGQWSSQTEPLQAPGADQHSRMLFGNARSRIRLSERDQLDVLYSGSRINLSDGGIPAGLEALTGNRMAPSFVLPGGFAGEPEADSFDALQAGWTHLFSNSGTLEVRYGYSTAHLDTYTDAHGQSEVELLGGEVSGAPPLANLAVRPRQEIAAAWQTRLRRHQIVAGGGWQTSAPENRFTAPSNMDLITANGVPAFAMEFSTPLDSTEHVRSFSGYVADRIRATSSLSLDLGILADFSRGSLPGGPDLIAWNSLSPRAWFGWQVPHARGLVLRGTYFRLDAPLAGRYLDFGDPNSLGGSAYAWNGSTIGSVLFRFGGPYSSISPSLHRPYSDEFDLGAEFPLAPRSTMSVHLFRRDDKDRLAAIDTGVPAQDYTALPVLDPGPDGAPGTFDDQHLTVYAQNPATLGQDRYRLTNPAGLRMLNTGMLAEASTAWRQLTLHASFLAEKSYGPTNPGDAVYENDPGVVGALFQDPNTSINAANRDFMDRAFVGKVQSTYRLPSWLGGIELSNIVNYLDGLVFARQLLVTGLPQGPFLVGTTVRGSPEGGNRAEYVMNWNLRLSRQFALPVGRFVASADILNVTNAAQRLQESDLSGTSFNLRLPVAIQPARLVRIGFRYEF